MANFKCALRCITRSTFSTISRRQLHVRSYSSKALSEAEIDEFLSKPSWSVRALQGGDGGGQQPDVTQKQLHHLLRLSALPLPKSPEEEASMIDTLKSQLHFVRAIQSVDTTGVRPLQSIRDETASADAANEITLETLKDDIAKEKQVGFSRRILREEETAAEQAEAEHFDAVAQAPKKLGRYIVVNTKED